MKYSTIIAGSRGFDNYDFADRILSKLPWEIGEVISGGARGADAIGEAWAVKNKYKLRIFPAEWETYGSKAGMIRNSLMASNAQALVAFWDGESKGTQHIIRTSIFKGLIVLVVSYKSILLLEGTE